jgi:hypothetical protein
MLLFIINTNSCSYMYIGHVKKVTVGSQMCNPLPNLTDRITYQSFKSFFSFIIHKVLHPHPHESVLINCMAWGGWVINTKNNKHKTMHLLKVGTLCFHTLRQVKSCQKLQLASRVCWNLYRPIWIIGTTLAL